MKMLFEGENSLIYYQENLESREPVIIKTLRENKLKNDSLIILLNNEYDFTNRLNLDCVRKALKKTNLNGKPVIILEYINGENLTSFFSSPRSLKEFLEIALKIAGAISVIHKNGIIHKNITSGNILIDRKTQAVKIIDFKYSKLFKEELTGFERPAEIEGKLSYISPEQTGRTNRLIDFRSDLYSVGVTFYELLTGKLPFSAEDSIGLIYAHIARTPVPPAELINSEETVLKPVSDIILKLMSKNPEERYQTAEGLKYDLELCLAALNNNNETSGFQPGQYDWSENFKVSQQLFGRENELNYLMERFENLSETGKAELVMISGPAGTGKTFLVNEFNKLLLKKKVCLAFGGKFEQFQPTQPYTVFINAVNNFISTILTEKPQVLEDYKQKILNAVGFYGQVLTEVIPDLELVIGKQLPVNPLSIIDAGDRFNHIFTRLIQSICHPDYPLLIFTDDIQWSDLSSVKLLLSLLNNSGTKNLMVIATYRSNEINTTFSLPNLLADTEKEYFNLNILPVKNLDKPDLSSLISDTLHCSPEEVNELTGLVYEKTRGNAFFVSQFLASLYQENLLWFASGQRKWAWDIQQINSLNVTDNVVDLLTAKIEKFPYKTQETLRLASCTGNEFYLDVLANITGQSGPDIFNELFPAIQGGLICPIPSAANKTELPESPGFRFLHDKVQQAVYSTIPEDKCLSLHLSIGKKLLKNHFNLNNQEILFNIVNHLNLARTLIHNRQEKLKLAAMNLKLARMVKLATAYDEVLRLTTIATGLLPPDSWTTDYELTFELYLLRVETESLTGNYQSADELYRTILLNARNESDKNSLYYIQLTHYSQQGRYFEAAGVMKKGVKLLGFTIPDSEARQMVLIAGLLMRIRLKMQGKKIPDLAELPEMTDLQQISLCNLLGVSLDIVIGTGQKTLFALIVLKIINSALEYGNNEMTILAYPFYATMLQAIFNDYKGSEEFSRLAVTLAKRSNNSILLCKVLTAVSSLLSHFYEHINYSLYNLNHAFDLVVESGNLIYVSYDVYYMALNSFFAGANLQT